MIRDANLYSGQTAECCQISTAKREGDHHSPRKWGKATGWLSNHEATLSQCMALQVIVPSEQSRLINYFIVGFSIFLLMPTHMMLDTYIYFAVIGFSLFGLGLAFYATPSTDAALSSLPSDQAGSGSGIYKMASSLGASFGVAISAAVFTALSGDDSAAQWLEGVIAYIGRQDNIAVREAAQIALGVNLLMVVAAIASIMMTIPKSATGSDG